MRPLAGLKLMMFRALAFSAMGTLLTFNREILVPLIQVITVGVRTLILLSYFTMQTARINSVNTHKWLRTSGRNSRLCSLW